MDVDVALREGDFDVVVVEGVVDGFHAEAGEADLLFDEHPDAYFQVDAALAKTGEGDADGLLGVDEQLSGGVLTLTGFVEVGDDELPHLFYIGAVGHADGNLDELVVVVAREVLEVLAEEGAVEERDDAAVGSDDLGALVGDALYLAVDAVALDVVAHAQATRHERKAVEEVLDEVLHGETETCGQAGGDDGDAALGHVEDDEGDDDVETPDDDGEDVAGEGEVEHFVG